MLKYPRRYLSKEASLCCIEVSMRPILGIAALFGDLAVHQPSISCKNMLLGLAQTAPMTPQLQKVS